MQKEPCLDIDLEDNELVSKIVETNNAELFGVLYDRHAPKVYNKCLGFLHDPAEAQDLTHDIFVHLFVKLRTFKGKSKFTTWLYSLTYNFCINYIQRDAERTHKKEEIREDIREFSENTISDERLYQLRLDKLQRAMKDIDPNDKALLIMKYQDDFSIKDIMEALEINESAVKMRLKRAKTKLLEAYNNIN